jgi:hypothetical protein
MKPLVTILFLLISENILSQESSIKFSWEFLNENKISLNTLEVPKGYAVFYNCDSMLFVRGDFADTIKIWTPGVEWAHTLEQFSHVIKKPEFGRTTFAKSILSDGRILVANYTETNFIFRNDSLFQVEDTVSKPQEYYTMMVDNMLGKIDKLTYKRYKDSIDLLYKDRHAYVPKLIFAKNMFQQGKKKVKLSPKLNYEQDEIELEQEWEEDQKKCYLVRINNGKGKEKTSYAYAINEDMKFVWWEGCRNRH